MKRLLSHFNGGISLVYFLIIITIAVIITMLISSKISGLKKDKKKFYIYTAIQALILLIFSSILYNLKDTSLTQRFISFQVYFTIAGIAHFYLTRNFFKKFEITKDYFEVILAMIVALFLAAILVIVLPFFNQQPYLLHFSTTLLFFIMPTLLYQLFEASVSIPAKLFKRWFYPLNSKYPTPQATEMTNIIILNLVFHKKKDDKQIINFKVKAPKAFDFGKLFYFFINDYNDKNPNAKIDFLDGNDQPYGWYFHTKPTWYGSTVHIDPDVSIDSNNIKDNSTIICQRI